MLCKCGTLSSLSQEWRSCTATISVRSLKETTLSSHRAKCTQRAHAATRTGAQPETSAHTTTRRVILSWGVTSVIGSAIADELTLQDRVDQTHQSAGLIATEYSRPGPFQPVRLPRLEHICSECFPRCLGDQCLLRIDVTYPKGVGNIGYGGPYPLAILTSGYLVGCDAYQSYADRLASWGYTVILYDKIESVADTLNDEVSARMITDIIDWCEVSLLMRQIADTSRVYLVGHSRGGKISSLAAVSDPRVAAMCLIDPVDTTVYAPLAPGFPSAVSALKQLPPDRSLPIAVVGSGIAGDCVPKYSNHARFFESVKSPAWEVVIQDSGHFSFLDHQSALQRAICPQGNVSEPDVRSVSQTIMVAWAEAMLRTVPTPETPCMDCPPASQVSDSTSHSPSRQVVSSDAGKAGVQSPRASQHIGQMAQDAVMGIKSSSNEGNQPPSTAQPSGNGQSLGTGVGGVGGRKDVGTLDSRRSDWAVGCLTVEIDRRPLSLNLKNDAAEGLQHEEENVADARADRNNRNSATVNSSSVSSSSSLHVATAGGTSSSETAGTIQKVRAERVRQASGNPAVTKVNSLTEWSKFGMSRTRGASWQRHRPFTDEPAAIRRELEGVLTRLQYQTFLSLSSKFRNF